MERERAHSRSIQRRALRRGTVNTGLESPPRASRRWEKKQGAKQANAKCKGKVAQKKNSEKKANLPKTGPPAFTSCMSLSPLFAVAGTYLIFPYI